MPEPIAAPEAPIVAPPALPTITAGVPAAAPPAAPPVAPAATPAPATPAAPAPAEPDKEPHWLPDRLRRAEEAARKAILKDLGVENPKDAKLALDAYKADQEAKKSELQKAQERAAALEAKANERDKYRTFAETQAASDLAALTPEQRAAVDAIIAITGDDPLNISAAIRALRPTWAVSQTAAPIAPVAPAAPPPMAAPTNTAAPAAAPRPTSPKSKWDEFQELERTNPRASGLFYSLNKLAIEASRPAQ